MVGSFQYIIIQIFGTFNVTSRPCVYRGLYLDTVRLISTIIRLTVSGYFLWGGNNNRVVILIIIIPLSVGVLNRINEDVGNINNLCNHLDGEERAGCFA